MRNTYIILYWCYQLIRWCLKSVISSHIVNALIATGCSGMVIGTLVYGTSYCIIRNNNNNNNNNNEALKFVEDVLHDAALETLMSFIGKVVAPKIIRYKTSKGIAKIITASKKISYLILKEITEFITCFSKVTSLLLN
ncbi:unnamed protein product [Rhizophagus irregularis]|nr:unnamed protein product [Rhizophagus irregularis]CAB5380165.1 unnamed protein product [Rhizophagus irregularis]